MTIDEIFASMPEEDAATGRDYLVIDPAARSITVPESEKIFGVEGDEDAARKYFICPRYVGDNLDLAGMFLTVYWRNAQGEEDGYMVEDVQIAGEYITFSWLLWPKVTQYNGPVQFAVCADLPNTATKRRPDWNTTLAEGEVLEGMDPDLGDLETGSSDVLTQLREMVTAQTAAVEATGADQVAEVKAQGTNTTQEAVAAIQAQGAATNASIPADYTALAATVDRLTRDRAAAIVCQAEGAAIQVQDASNDPLQGLRIFGRSTQDGTPTPDNPVEIVSTPAPVVAVCGKNLLPYPYIFSQFSKDGVTVAANADGTIVINGTATANVWVGITENVVLSAGTYTLSIFPDNWVAENGYVLWQGKNTHTGTIVATIKEATSEGVGVVLLSGATYNNVILRPMIERGSGATGYEPYTGQTLTITTPGSLPGIPVSSGGNYTDDNGQQWIADEVDLARGVCVQRVALDELATATNYANRCLYCRLESGKSKLDNVFISSHSAAGLAFANGATAAYTSCVLGPSTLPETVADLNSGQAWLEQQKAAGTPVIVGYVLTEPVETPLSDVELQAYLAMHSNKPTTTVLNDAGAHMVLEYTADPKTFICNQIAAAIAAK